MKNNCFWAKLVWCSRRRMISFLPSCPHLSLRQMIANEANEERPNVLFTKPSTSSTFQPVSIYDRIPTNRLRPCFCASTRMEVRYWRFSVGTPPRSRASPETARSSTWCQSTRRILISDTSFPWSCRSILWTVIVSLTASL